MLMNETDITKPGAGEEEEEEIRFIRRRRRRKLTPLQLGVVIALGALFLLPLLFYIHSKIVVTPEEQVENRFFDLREAVLERNYQGLENLLADSYNGTIGSDREEAVELAEYFLENVDDFKVKILTVNVTLEQTDRAILKSSFEYYGFWTGNDMYRRIPFSGGVPKALPGEVEAVFVMQNETWKLQNVELVLDGHDFRR